MKKMKPEDIKTLTDILIKLSSIIDELNEELDKGDVIIKKDLFNHMLRITISPEDRELIKTLFVQPYYVNPYNTNPMYGNPYGLHVSPTINWNGAMPNPIPPYASVSAPTTSNPTTPPTFYDPLKDLGMSIFDKPEEKFVADEEAVEEPDTEEDSE